MILPESPMASKCPGPGEDSGLHQEELRLAGWFDGHRCGRAQTFNELALRLEARGFSLDTDGHLASAAQTSPRFVVPEPETGGGTDYARGFECGFSAARTRLVLQVREHLQHHSCFLSDGLRVLTHAETSDLVDGLAPVITPRSEPASRTAASHEGGIWSMVVSNFTRRAALIVFSSTIVAGSLGWIGAMHMARPAPPPPPPTWTPPTLWDSSLGIVKQAMLAIDQVAWNLEQTEGSPSPTLLGQMQIAFAQQDPNGEVMRQLYCRWICERDRPGYADALITQLHPSLQGVETRCGILRALSFLHELNTPSFITTSQRITLQNYLNSNAEDDERVYEQLVRLVDSLVAAGI